jgi:hypothetical protein
VNPLEEVLTVREVSILWDKHPKTIRRAIQTGRYPLDARKSPEDARGAWLISRASCIRRWGAVADASANSAHGHRDVP